MNKGLAVIAAILCSTTVSAEVPVSFYMQVKKAGGINYEHLKTYYSGVGHGLFWANIVLGAKHQKELWCPPDKLALNQQNYVEILDTAIEQQITKPEDPTELLLERQLEITFPCDKK